MRRCRLGGSCKFESEEVALRRFGLVYCGEYSTLVVDRITVSTNLLALSRDLVSL